MLQEYRALVAAQNGYTAISSDEKVLLRQYLESLYHLDEVEDYNNSVSNESSSITTNTVTTTTNMTNIFNELESIVNQYGSSITKQVPPKTLTAEEREKARLDSLNASYSFAMETDNNMEGNYLQQVETRKNGKVYGRYSFDDLNNFITRYYIADENGFRIVK